MGGSLSEIATVLLIHGRTGFLASGEWRRKIEKLTLAIQVVKWIQMLHWFFLQVNKRNQLLPLLFCWNRKRMDAMNKCINSWVKEYYWEDWALGSSCYWPSLAQHISFSIRLFELLKDFRYCFFCYRKRGVPLWGVCKWRHPIGCVPGREKKNMLLFLVEERGVPIEQEFRGTVVDL